MSWLKRRNAIRNLAVGAFAGALAAAGSVTVICGLLWVVVGMFLLLSASLDTFIVIVAFILVAGIQGAVAGLLIAIVDHLIGGRLHDGRMPFWPWLLIGSVMGVAGSVPLAAFPAGTKVSASSIAFLVIIGAPCGLVAGPLFGWVYGQWTQPKPARQGGEWAEK